MSASFIDGKSFRLLAEEANFQYKTLTEHMEGQRNAESHLKGLIASRFDIIDKLGKTYYERENTASQQAPNIRKITLATAISQIVRFFIRYSAKLERSLK